MKVSASVLKGMRVGVAVGLLIVGVAEDVTVPVAAGERMDIVPVDHAIVGVVVQTGGNTIEYSVGETFSE